ncbi:hypothetical protein DV096_16705 [Bradymonadaceae bacterium TMQ3]|uniref:Uncharacterized protein n=1 Tax=Lujinxingia sediminis TaxID=2480984 RepID=A0ABY0CPP6_9DELT|nr:hypothetical protein [Lujinxingia sediminis]RDV36729.1 hypothetical protein DV096_16705 [Bradymonadaceae bacterium TMQ3]RVU41536.1 hypothetical protein EA187_17915 [Lujinxingia sediminis]TXC69351.1 hypothetical protein FRC91_17285 [Bradymonadales bacterium TMQ1]
MEWERLLTHLGTALLGALVTLGGAVMAAWRKHRESELLAGQSLRDELREELRETREELRRVREELEQMKSERLVLKRALDTRDETIRRLQVEVAMLQEGQRRLEVRSDSEAL